MTTTTETLITCPPSAVHDMIVPFGEVGEGDLILWDGEFRLVTCKFDYCGEPLMWFDGRVAGPGTIPCGTYAAIRRYDTEIPATGAAGHALLTEHHGETITAHCQCGEPLGQSDPATSPAVFGRAWSAHMARESAR